MSVSQTNLKVLASKSFGIFAIDHAVFISFVLFFLNKAWYSNVAKPLKMLESLIDHLLNPIAFAWSSKFSFPVVFFPPIILWICFSCCPDAGLANGTTAAASRAHLRCLGQNWTTGTWQSTDRWQAIRYRRVVRQLQAPSGHLDYVSSSAKESRSKPLKSLF